jgi:hypothetical protein
MKQIIFLSFSLVFFCLQSCKQESEKVISFEDIVAHSKRDYSEENNIEVTSDSTFYDRLTKEDQSFINALGFQKKDVYEKDTNFFLDRFGHLSHVNFAWKDSIARLERGLSIWKYKDSSSMVNAFFNSLDCYGPSCGSLRIGESYRLRNKKFTMLVGNKEIIYLEGISYPNQFIDSLIRFKGFENWNYILSQTTKTKWFVYKENQITPLKLEQ